LPFKTGTVMVVTVPVIFRLDLQFTLIFKK